MSSGMGHVARCRTIAFALRERFCGKVSFIAAEMPDHIVDDLQAVGIDTIRISNPMLPEEEAIKAITSVSRRSALVVDSFKPAFYTRAFQQTMAGAVSKFVFIAFDSGPHYCAHVLHNQNPIALHVPFACEPYTKKLFGLQHVILNERVRKLAANATPAEPREDGLVALLTFGGSDPYNLTSKTVEALGPLASRFSRVIVVTGGMFPHHDELNHVIGDCGIEVEVFRNVSDMPNIMNRCDVAFTSGGITNWELGALGKPVIILPIGEREALSAEYLQLNGLAQHIRNPQCLEIPDLTMEISLKLRLDMYEMSSRLRQEIHINGVETLVASILD